MEGNIWRPETTVAGDYRILFRLGGGAMTEVFKATICSSAKLCAIKKLKRDLVSEPAIVELFKNEGLTVRDLRHPNVARVDEVLEAEDGCPFIVMEYIEGRTLKMVLQEEGAQPVPRVREIMLQTAKALDSAHSSGILHLGITPTNIMLADRTRAGSLWDEKGNSDHSQSARVRAATPNDKRAEARTGTEMVKVLDFGMTKLKKARTHSSVGIASVNGVELLGGKADYISPEQAEGLSDDHLDHRVDLYSYGVVMYELLAGALPFAAETLAERIIAHIKGAPMPMRVTRPDLQVPGALEELVMRCLAKRKGDRPSTAREIIEELQKTGRSDP